MYNFDFNVSFNILSHLNENIFYFQVDELMSSIQKIDIEVQSLATCAFKKETFEEILTKIQKSVDELNLHSYSNLSAWVKTLDNQVWNLGAKFHPNFNPFEYSQCVLKAGLR